MFLKTIKYLQIKNITAVMRMIIFLFFLSFAIKTNAQELFTSGHNEEIETAKTWIEQAENGDNFIDNLKIYQTNTLPIGYKKTIANADVMLAISKITYHEYYASVDVFARVKIPAKNTELFFGGKDIKMSYDGDFIGDAHLTLLGDIEIPLDKNGSKLTLKGRFDAETGTSGLATYMTLSCEGVDGFGITAEVTLPDFIKKVNEKGEPVENSKVSTTFSVQAKNLSDIVAEISIPDFAIGNLDGFVFSCNKMVFDFSDYTNNPNMTFPVGYKENYLIPGNENLWRGFFAKEIRITLPAQFEKKEGTGNSKRISFVTENLLIDENGVTGLFSVEYPILPFNEGTASGWSFSVEKFTLVLEANSLVGGGFAGNIGIPTGGGSKLEYNALFDGKNYYMNVQPVDTLSFDVFKAKATILPESYIQLNVVDKKFRPEAMLHGSLGIEVKNKEGEESKAGFKGVKFQSMHIKTQAPYFSVAYFGYSGSGSNFVNMPISINEIGLRSQGNELSLIFDFDVKLADMIQAGVGFSINGEMGISGGKQSWKYKSFSADRIAIDATLAGVFSLKGNLYILNDDPDYGNGVYGNIKLQFEKGLPGFFVEASAMFGKKGYSYWFVDAKVGLPAPIQVGPIGLSGFSGGASMRMRKSGSTKSSLSGSGCGYIPDESYALGVKAGVLFVVPNDKLINGEASFEILFNKHGGVNFLGFYGAAKFLAEIDIAGDKSNFITDALKKSVEKENNYSPSELENIKLNQKQNAVDAAFSSSLKHGESGMSASVAIEFDFVNKSFHANFEAYANFAGGLIRGTGTNNRAGWATIHISENDWYMYIGTPDNKIGVKAGIGDFSVSLGSYFMAGKEIPGSPPPPQQVADILGVQLSELDYMRDLNSLGTGKGIAFGADLSIDTGDMKFLILYARFMAGVGFDIMMKEYKDAYCKGRDGRIGMDGWYANGQVYVYLQGEVGVDVNLAFIKKKIIILKAGAAALMQGQLPNPAWFQGYLGVSYNVLGGLVKGNAKFKITIGEKCDMVTPGASPIDLEIIGDLTPAGEADVFAIPQAAFNAEIDKAFHTQNVDGEDIYLKVVLENMSVVDEAGNNVIGEFVWNNDKTKLSFYSHEILKPNSNFTAYVSLNFEEFISGTWRTIYTGGVKSVEKREVKFRTGEAPDNIPMENIEYTYPVVDQYNFFAQEHNKGFVRLQRGQSYLFENDMIYTANFLSEDGGLTTIPLTYNAADKQLNYNIPASLTRNKVHNLILAAKVKDAADKSKTGSTAYKQTGDADNSVSVRERSSDELIRDDIGKELLAFAFRTSTYPTFEKRIKGINKKSDYFNRISSSLIGLGYSVSNMEAFDIAELQGTKYSGYLPLVKAEATLEDVYYKEDIYPYLYKDYPKYGIGITRRETNETGLGIPPKYAVEVSPEYIYAVNNNNKDYMGNVFPYEYNLQIYYSRDFYDMRDGQASYFVNTGNMPILLDYNILFIRGGNYRTKLSYILPDGTVTSSAYFDFKNSITFR
jgi:hypothetical protein